MFQLLDVTDPKSAPRALNFPYHYSPHPWVLLAAKHVRAHLERTAVGQAGRMVAILVVKNEKGQIGFLTGCDQFDTDDRYFEPNFWQQLPTSEMAPIATDYLDRAEKLKQIAEQNYLNFRESATERRVQRRQERQVLGGASYERLARASQRDSGELERLKRRYHEALDEVERAHGRFQHEAAQVVANDWKKRLGSIDLRNAWGKQINLFDLLFERYGHNEELLKAILRTSLPALIKRAFDEHMRPLTTGTFWWGPVAANDARVPNAFYAFPKERHEALLGFLLDGVPFEPNTLAQDSFKDWQPDILYEDDHLVAVNKPAGMLSVPGKHPIANVYEKMLARYPQADGPMLLHRLDMATSGVLLFAKTKLAHMVLQEDFARGRIKKCYIALLEKPLAGVSGEVELPLCLNPYERPRQMVDFTYGRYALTRFEVLGQTNGKTRVAFYPVTGRTHQLRLHAAHALGLNSPIVGDDLYGEPSDRLYLHAQSIAFTHPVTHEAVTVEAPCPF